MLARSGLAAHEALRFGDGPSNFSRALIVDQFVCRPGPALRDTRSRDVPSALLAQLKVDVHMLGYVADTTQEAADTFFPGYAKAMTDVGKGRGWPAMTRASFDAQRGRDGALLIGSPDQVLRHVEALGGLSRISFQMNVASLPQAKMMRAIDARVLPALHPFVVKSRSQPLLRVKHS